MMVLDLRADGTRARPGITLRMQPSRLFPKESPQNEPPSEHGSSESRKLCKQLRKVNTLACLDSESTAKESPGCGGISLPTGMICAV